jgi:hypothetical protein
MRVAVAIPETPPSLNQWLSRHWRVRDREKRALELVIHAHLVKAGFVGRYERIEAEVVFRFPDRRKRDTGNYSSTLEKCLGDVLKGRWIADDDAQRFYMRSARISEQRGPAETLLVIDGLHEERGAA